MANLFTANFAADIVATLEAYAFRVDHHGDSLTAWSRGGTPLYLHIVEDPGGRQSIRWTAAEAPTSTPLAEFDAATLRAWLSLTYTPKR